ncbi:hypothetical protein HGRIS_005767 [Hohenbuehelia grisea]|uniref:Uncharacterized protein n=1 Tax=Hohenbuehelia grisea TaxID=104357 RepID=A0ABR3JZQ8_9AGAR
MRAVAWNVAGPALPIAMQYVRYRINLEVEMNDGSESGLNLPPILPDASLGSLDTPFTTTEVRALSAIANLAARLEILLSRLCKDKRSKNSRLSPSESWRLRRALYRIMIYCAVFGLDRPPMDAGFDQIPQSVRTEQKDFFADMDTTELAELQVVVTFLKDLGKCACLGDDLDNDLLILVAFLFLYGPHAILHCYEQGTLGDIYEAQYNDFAFNDLPADPILAFIDGPLTAAFSEHELSMDTVVQSSPWRPLLDEIAGEDDKYWDLLKGRISISELLSLTKGNLRYNASDRVNMRVALLECPSAQLFDEIFDLKTADFSDWSKDDWFCLGCLKTLFAANSAQWFLEYKRKMHVGFPIPSKNCPV